MKRLELSYLDVRLAQQYEFLSVSLKLFQHKDSSELDGNDKILYSLMLNRTSLSYQNKDRFTDFDGRVYIYYTLDNIIEQFGCAKSTAVKMIDNLTHIGLIKKARQGQGKSNLCNGFC